MEQPLHQEYLSRLLRSRTDQSSCPDTECKKDAATSTCLGILSESVAYQIASLVISDFVVTIVKDQDVPELPANHRGIPRRFFLLTNGRNL